MKTLAALAALALLAACASGQTGGPRVDWRCDGGAAFSVRHNAQGEAEVFAGGRTYELPAAPSGSGARYAEGGVEYWEHQGEARLTGAFGGPYNNCRSS